MVEVRPVAWRPSSTDEAELLFRAPKIARIL
jgi:hypothetical protein